MTEPSTATHPSDEATWALDFITRIVDQCPRRIVGTESERRAHDMLAAELEQRGVATRFHAFRWNRSLYANMALHFTLACVASALFFVWTPAALGLHALVALSYFLDSTRKGHLLRRVFPLRQSRNLLATLPPAGEMRRRVVLISHIDAAFTGFVFEPSVIKLATREPPLRVLGFMRKQMLVATGSVALCAALDLAAMLVGVQVWMIPTLAVLSIPALIAAVLNGQVVLRNEAVPGANDNLTGCAGGVLLLERLADDKPDDVELVLVATGSEEAGTGGAFRLAQAMTGVWSKEDTVIVAIDGLSNGEMRYMEDGEIVRLRIPAWLEAAAADAASSDPRFAQVKPFQIPAGGSDAAPFEAMGWPGIALVCVDPEIGAPRHYHHPSDTPANLDMDQFMLSVDYIEAVVRRIWTV